MQHYINEAPAGLIEQTIEGDSIAPLSTEVC